MYWITIKDYIIVIGIFSVDFTFGKSRPCIFGILVNQFFKFIYDMITIFIRLAIDLLPPIKVLILINICRSIHSRYSLMQAISFE